MNQFEVLEMAEHKYLLLGPVNQAPARTGFAGIGIVQRRLDQQRLRIHNITHCSRTPGKCSFTKEFVIAWPTSHQRKVGVARINGPGQTTSAKTSQSEISFIISNQTPSVVAHCRDKLYCHCGTFSMAPRGETVWL